LKLHIERNQEQVAVEAALFVAEEARRAIDARGVFLLAVSGGTTPWKMLRELAYERLPWEAVHLFQVDERLAPRGDAARNLTHLEESFLRHVSLPADHVHAMPVEDADVEEAASRYAVLLAELAGTPPVLDVVHLGLGTDGHTASLVPGDAALESRATVALTGTYAGHRRMTLTFDTLAQARCVLWLVTGADKAERLVQVVRQDSAIPAGRVATGRAVVFADREAAEFLSA